jgi:hypothetical protein
VFHTDDGLEIGKSMAAEVYKWGRRMIPHFIEIYLTTRAYEVRQEIAKKLFPEKFAKIGVTLIGIYFNYYNIILVIYFPLTNTLY